jgi:hypothetical protein
MINLIGVSPLNSFHRNQLLSYPQLRSSMSSNSRENGLYNKYILIDSLTPAEMDATTLMNFNISMTGTSETIQDPYVLVQTATQKWFDALQSGEFAAKLAELAQENGASELALAQPGAMSVSNVEVETIDEGNNEDNNGSSSESSPTSLTPGETAGIVLGCGIGLVLLIAAAYYAYIRFVKKGLSPNEQPFDNISIHHGPTISLPAIYYNDEFASRDNSL